MCVGGDQQTLQCVWVGEALKKVTLFEGRGDGMANPDMVTKDAAK